MSAKRSIIPIFVPHLGCPNDCVFCNQRRISGQLTPATAETVTATIEAALEKLPAGTEPEVAFYGGSFTAIPAGEQEKLLGSALPFLRSGEISAVRVSTRPDCVDEETLSRLKSCGVGTVELGVQSMDPEVLSASNRGHTPGDAVRAAALVRRMGFGLMLQMMTGLPGDTPEKDVMTAKRFCEMEPSGVRIYPTVIIRDTALYDMWKRGDYKEHTVEDAVEICSVLLDIFEHAGIPVIRLGLNPTDELSGGSAAGGAYHPALGELVMSRRYLKKGRELLQGCRGADSVVIGVAKGQVSAMTGQRRENILSLRRELGIGRIKVIETDILRGEIRILVN